MYLPRPELLRKEHMMRTHAHFLSEEERHGDHARTTDSLEGASCHSRTRTRSFFNSFSPVPVVVPLEELSVAPTRIQADSSLAEGGGIQSSLQRF